MAAKKVCKDCQSPTRPATQPGPRCATCSREFKRQQKRRTYDRYVQETYGITADQAEAIQDYQGGRCACCQRATGAARSLAIDHDHSTGLVRGRLCKTCNKTIGYWRDDPEAFERAAAYLRNPPAFEVVGKVVAPIFGREKEVQGRRRKTSRRKSNKTKGKQ